ncbi:SOS response-associated peptidase [Salinarimonas soli]|uniref:Abasic site processing protein n=1 Tax=Salinarimonas soli TaxID=1638099 RepID=A0A5B2VXV3_9HYPH|nr:SOS response-associated peptidase [Salinarimonas soli]KAA2244201.1 SOS response-associated peptidase [Salinarimonas soli]
MCGRFAITLAPETFREAYGYDERPNFPPRYNVAPTQPIALVHGAGGARHFRLARWGFLPGWVKDPKSFPLVINARGETLLEKPTFRAALKRRRCIVLADGFYEWRREGKAKAPFLIRRTSRGPLHLAGLWETYSDPQGGEIDTAAIVTTDANGLMSAVHDRMPAILDAAGIAPWLDVDGVDDRQAMALVHPCPDGWLDLTPVSPRVNDVRNDDPGVQEPLAQPAPRPVPEPSRTRPGAPRSSDEDEQGALF